MSREADRHARILRAAAAYFLHDGFERTTIDKIAASAHVSKQVIYELFSSKECLFEKVIESEIENNTLTGSLKISDIETTLSDFSADLFDRFAQPHNFGLFRANLVAARKFPVVAAMLHERRRAASKDLANYLQGRIAEGSVMDLGNNAIDLASRLGGMVVEGTRYFLGYTLPIGRQRAKLVARGVHVFLEGARDAPDEPWSDAELSEPATAPPGQVQRRLKPDRFEALCDAAAAEFLDHGFDGANIDRITRATGIGRATIYRQMGSKEGLLRYVMGREFDRMRSLPNIAEAADSLVALKELSRAVLDLHLEPRSIALHHFLIQEAQLFPDLARRFYDLQVERLRVPFEHALERAGLAKPSAGVVRAYHVLASYGVRYIGNKREVDEAERDQVSGETATIILHGMKARG